MWSLPVTHSARATLALWSLPVTYTALTLRNLPVTHTTRASLTLRSLLVTHTIRATLILRSLAVTHCPGNAASITHAKPLRWTPYRPLGYTKKTLSQIVTQPIYTNFIRSQKAWALGELPRVHVQYPPWFPDRQRNCAHWCSLPVVRCTTNGNRCHTRRQWVIV